MDKVPKMSMNGQFDVGMCSAEGILRHGQLRIAVFLVNPYPVLILHAESRKCLQG